MYLIIEYSFKEGKINSAHKKNKDKNLCCNRQKFT